MSCKSLNHPEVTGKGLCRLLAGAVTTLGRGGSDLSATVLGAALGVREVQVWKDVDGEPFSLPISFPSSPYLLQAIWSERLLPGT